MREPQDELRFGGKIRQLLDTHDVLEPQVLERLRVSRERALDRMGAAGEAVPALAGAGNAIPGGGLRWFPQIVVPLCLLAIGALSLHSAQQTLDSAKQLDLDAKLLSDELPIDAYLDHGFEAWLKKQRNR